MRRVLEILSSWLVSGTDVLAALMSKSVNYLLGRISWLITCYLCQLVHNIEASYLRVDS